MTDSEIVELIDHALERRGIRVEITEYGPPLEDTMSKDAIALWESLGCAGADNHSQVIAIAQCDAPESVKKELIDLFLNNKKELAESRADAYRTIAEWWFDCKSEETARYVGDAKEPVVVEVNDDSVKRLAEATGKSVKKAIKPGKGSSNEQWPPEAKAECVRIWGYRTKDAVKKHAYKRKVSYEDVFEYAKDELDKIGITSADEFRRVLGAVSDRKSRNSPAKRKKPR